MAKAEFVLGLIGGFLGLLFTPFILFAGVLTSVFVGTSILIYMAVIGGILSIIGVVGAAILEEKPKIAGIMMLVAGIAGIPVLLGFFMGSVLLIIAGTIALMRKDKKK